MNLEWNHFMPKTISPGRVQPTIEIEADRVPLSMGPMEMAARIRALEEECRCLRKLVCHLLQENHSLRLSGDADGGAGPTPVSGC